jgi:hypothetical protein
VQEKVLIYHQNRQEVLKSLGIKYVWWVDRERSSLVPRTKNYLENVHYDCLGEKKKILRVFEKTLEIIEVTEYYFTFCIGHCAVRFFV